MNLEQRTQAFIQLGKTLTALNQSQDWQGFKSGLTLEEFTDIQKIIDDHKHTNGWFTRAQIVAAIKAWGILLSEENINKWIAQYDLKAPEKRTIAIICAGNIPLVGFHDVLSVLISGHRALVKLSSSDNQLIPAILKILTKLEPAFEKQYEIAPEKLVGYDAVIATGSNNSSRYFKYYFKHVPCIIRKSRTSVAVVTGNESDEELTALGNDVFDYFGLGCRSVSKLFLPENFQMDKFFNAIFHFSDVVNHNKYANNYDYNKAVWLLNQDDLLDNGFILLKQDERLASPTASLFYSYYKTEKDVEATINKHKDEIQCVVGTAHIPFGMSQSPQLWDYADDVDTLQFISTLP